MGQTQSYVTTLGNPVICDYTRDGGTNPVICDYTRDGGTDPVICDYTRDGGTNPVISLVPRRGGGGGERAPGTHCLRMRVIIGKATW